MFLLLLVEGLEPDGGYESDSDGSDTLYLDDDTLIVLDALDDTFCIPEVTIDDADAAAWGAEVFCTRIEIDQTVILNGGDTDEVVHLAVRNGQEIVIIAMGERVGDIAQWQAILVEHLQLGDTLLRRVDEDEVANGGLEVLVGHSLIVNPATKSLHGKEIVDIELVECIFDILLTTIGNTHGIP